MSIFLRTSGTVVLPCSSPHAPATAQLESGYYVALEKEEARWLCRRKMPMRNSKMMRRWRCGFGRLTAKVKARPMLPQPKMRSLYPRPVSCLSHVGANDQAPLLQGSHSGKRLFLVSPLVRVLWTIADWTSVRRWRVQSGRSPCPEVDRTRVHAGTDSTISPCQTTRRR